MKKTRVILFWLHLVVGLAAGLPILAMSFTGAALAFEKQLIKWAERDARQITPPADPASRLPLDVIVQRVREARPDFRVQSLSLFPEGNAALMLNGPNGAALCVNPYTGEVREASAPRMRAFMSAMRRWHTHLDWSQGSHVNDPANVLFLLLSLTGLWLWWPSAWKWRMLRPAIWFQTSARGRARDWNWHNVFGFWSLPIVVVMTATGIVLSYRQVNDLMFRLAGDPLPARGPAAPAQAAPPPTPGVRPPAASSPSPAVRAPAAPPPGINAEFVASTVTPLLTTAQTTLPSWQQITLRVNPPNKASVTVDYAAAWPAFSATTFAFDKTTGQTQRSDTYSSASAGRRARMWVRLSHSGESLGWPGQLLAGLACLGGCLLVWTGFAMSWRRFFGGKAA